MKHAQVAAAMAESQRHIERVQTVDEKAQAAHDRNTLLFFLFAGIAAVAGMFWIAGFLSQGANSPLNPPLYVLLGSGVVAAVFYVLTRKTA